MRAIYFDITEQNTALKASEFIPMLQEGVLKWMVVRYATPNTAHNRENTDSPEMLYNPGESVPSMVFKEVVPDETPSIRYFVTYIDPETKEPYYKGVDMLLPEEVNGDLDQDNTNILAAIPAGNNIALELPYKFPK